MAEETKVVQETKVVRKKRNYKSRRFWLIYAICALVLLAGVAVFNIKIWDEMIRYEDSQPEHLLEDAIANLQAGNVEVSMSGKFEDASALAKEELMSAIQGKELTYMLDSKSFDNEAPIYDVLLDDKTVCKITMQATNKRTMLAILTIYDWSVASVDPVLSKGDKAVKITAPANYTVKVNGIELGKEEQVGEPAILEGFEAAATYVEVPRFVTYEVKELYREPAIDITDQYGQAVVIPEDANLQELTVGYEESEIDSELAAMALNNAKTYMNYFSTDLPGCSLSIDPIRYMFPSDSNYLVLAEIYRTGDMWMYSDHDYPVFSNEVVSHYTSYSEDLFVVEVSFTRSMILQNAERSYREEVNDQFYTYVKIDGTWYIAEMMENLNR